MANLEYPPSTHSAIGYRVWEAFPTASCTLVFLQLCSRTSLSITVIETASDECANQGQDIGDSVGSCRIRVVIS